MDNSNFAIVIVITSIALVFFLIWIIVVLPQNRARKVQQEVVSDLKVGDQIVTVGGLIGKLTYLNIDEDIARLEISNGVEVRIIPAAISHPLDYKERIRKANREGVARKRKPGNEKQKGMKA
ncbi:MAG TPA: preprotein translocase subunit YajC [Anaerolineae bacterium]|jgi:preprotein translocase subunit YajC